MTTPITRQPNQDRINRRLWWQRAWGLTLGCTHVSPGCDHCWAASQTHMWQFNPNEKIRTRNAGLTTPEGQFNGTVRFRNDNLWLPDTIKKPTVFAVWNDLFHEGVTDHEIWKALATMRFNPQHTFIILTKRAQRMFDLLADLGWAGVLKPNIWIGVTAENQEQWDARVPLLDAIPAPVKLVSIEPMLGPIDMGNAVYGMDWIIAGGESGHGYRPDNPDWYRSLRDQCDASDTAYFQKHLSGRQTPPDDLAGCLAFPEVNED